MSGACASCCSLASVHTQVVFGRSPPLVMSSCMFATQPRSGWGYCSEGMEAELKRVLATKCEFTYRPISYPGSGANFSIKEFRASFCAPISRLGEIFWLIFPTCQIERVRCVPEPFVEVRMSSPVCHCENRMLVFGRDRRYGFTTSLWRIWVTYDMLMILNHSCQEQNYRNQYRLVWKKAFENRH